MVRGAEHKLRPRAPVGEVSHSGRITERRRSHILCRQALVAGLLLASAFQAAASPRTEREAEEVRAIFATVLARLKPGDGLRFDMPCVISETWPAFKTPKGEIRQHPLLTPRRAMDPQNVRPDEFCDLEERNAEARRKATTLGGSGRTAVVTADLNLTYPIFDARLTRAEIQRSGANHIWYKDGRKSFVASGGTIYLVKTKGTWKARFETEWIAN